MRPSCGPGRKPSSIRSFPSTARSRSRCGLERSCSTTSRKRSERVDLLERRRLAVGPALAEQVGVLVVEEVEGELVAVSLQKAPRAERRRPCRAGTCGGARSARRAAATRSDTAAGAARRRRGRRRPGRVRGQRSRASRSSGAFRRARATRRPACRGRGRAPRAAPAARSPGRPRPARRRTCARRR